MNIAPDAWQADTEALRERAQQAERERDEARRIARHARQLKRDEEDHRMEVEAQVIRLEARIQAVRDWHTPEMTYRLMDGEDYAMEPDMYCCVVCQEQYPCHTIRALDGTVTPDPQ